jgi:hypothetical protein
MACFAALFPKDLAEADPEISFDLLTKVWNAC